MSSDMRGEPPAVTEDSDLVDIIRKTYSGRVGRRQKTSDFCVGGALSHYFLRYEDDWNKKSFPFADQLTNNLMCIIQHQGKTPEGMDIGDLYDSCEYYAEAIVNANDDGIYDDAWIHVDMFLEEFGIDGV